MEAGESAEVSRSQTTWSFQSKGKKFRSLCFGKPLSGVM